MIFSIQIYIDHVPFMIAKPQRVLYASGQVSIDSLKSDIFWWNVNKSFFICTF